MNEVLAWVLENWDLIAEGALGLGVAIGIIVKLTPTKKDDEWYEDFGELWDDETTDPD